MAVQHDAWDSRSFTTVSPFTFTFTPVGQPRGILYLIVQNDSLDHLTGALTYGGVALTRWSTAADVSGETGRAYGYHLGSGIPAGPQTVSVTHDGSAIEKFLVVASVLANSDTEIVASNIAEANQADPQVIVDSAIRESLGYLAFFGGQGSPGLYTLLANETALDSKTFSPSTTIGRADREIARLKDARRLGYINLGDDVALVAGLIAEVAPTVASGTQGPLSLSSLPPTLRAA